MVETRNRKKQAESQGSLPSASPDAETHPIASKPKRTTRADSRGSTVSHASQTSAAAPKSRVTRSAQLKEVAPTAGKKRTRSNSNHDHESQPITVKRTRATRTESSSREPSNSFEGHMTRPRRSTRTSSRATSRASSRATSIEAPAPSPTHTELSPEQPSARTPPKTKAKATSKKTRAKKGTAGPGRAASRASSRASSRATSEATSRATSVESNNRPATRSTRSKKEEVAKITKGKRGNVRKAAAKPRVSIVPEELPQSEDEEAAPSPTDADIVVASQATLDTCITSQESTDHQNDVYLTVEDDGNGVEKVTTLVKQETEDDLIIVSTEHILNNSQPEIFASVDAETPVNTFDDAYIETSDDSQIMRGSAELWQDADADAMTHVGQEQPVEQDMTLQTVPPHKASNAEEDQVREPSAELFEVAEETEHEPETEVENHENLSVSLEAQAIDLITPEPAPVPVQALEQATENDVHQAEEVEVKDSSPPQSSLKDFEREFQAEEDFDDLGSSPPPSPTAGRDQKIKNAAAAKATDDSSAKEQSPTDTNAETSTATESKQGFFSSVLSRFRTWPFVARQNVRPKPYDRNTAIKGNTAIKDVADSPAPRRRIARKPAVARTPNVAVMPGLSPIIEAAEPGTGPRILLEPALHGNPAHINNSAVSIEEARVPPKPAPEPRSFLTVSQPSIPDNISEEKRKKRELSDAKFRDNLLLCSELICRKSNERSEQAKAERLQKAGEKRKAMEDERSTTEADSGSYTTSTKRQLQSEAEEPKESPAIPQRPEDFPEGWDSSSHPVGRRVMEYARQNHVWIGPKVAWQPNTFSCDFYDSSDSEPEGDSDVTMAGMTPARNTPATNSGRTPNHRSHATPDTLKGSPSKVQAASLASIATQDNELPSEKLSGRTFTVPVSEASSSPPRIPGGTFAVPDSDSDDDDEEYQVSPEEEWMLDHFTRYEMSLLLAFKVYTGFHQPSDMSAWDADAHVRSRVRAHERNFTLGLYNASQWFDLLKLYYVTLDGDNHGKQTKMTEPAPNLFAGLDVQKHPASSPKAVVQTGKLPTTEQAQATPGRRIVSFEDQTQAVSSSQQIGETDLQIPPTPQPQHATLPATPTTPTRANAASGIPSLNGYTDLVAKQRALAEKHKPKTPSGLRSASAAASSPLASSPLAPSPLPSEALASDAFASSSIASGALASSPIASNALAGDVLASGAPAGDVLASDALASDALASGALASDPFAGGPVAPGPTPERVPQTPPLQPAPNTVEAEPIGPYLNDDGTPFVWPEPEPTNLPPLSPESQAAVDAYLARPEYKAEALAFWKAAVTEWEQENGVAQKIPDEYWEIGATG